MESDRLLDLSAAAEVWCEVLILLNRIRSGPINLALESDSGDMVSQSTHLVQADSSRAHIQPGTLIWAS